MTQPAAHTIERRGYALAATSYAAPRGVGALVVGPAMGVRRGFYDRFAKAAAGFGLSTLVFDWNGIGDSAEGSARSCPATLSTWADDAGAVLASVRGPVAWLGHSVGGQLVGLAPGNHQLAGIVLIGAQMGDWRLWTGAGRARRWLDWHVTLPTLAATLGHAPAWALGAPIPGGVIREWATWGRTPGYLLGGPDGPARQRAFDRVTAPVLALSVDDDAYAPSAAVDALAAAFRMAPVRRQHLRPADVGLTAVGHFGWFKEPMLWPPVLGWLRGRLTGETL